MSRIVQTALDVDGNLIKKGVKEVKTVKIFRLDDDPFLWTDIVRKNTRNRDAAFCNKFLKDNKFDTDMMSSISSWLSEYYTAFLMELCKVICDLGVLEIKTALHSCFKAWSFYNEKISAAIEHIPDDISNSSKAETISAAFLSFTNIGHLFITEE